MIRRLGVAVRRPGYHRPVPPSRSPRHEARAGAAPPRTFVAAVSVPLLLGALVVAGGVAVVRPSPAGGAHGTVPGTAPVTRAVASSGGVHDPAATARAAARGVSLQRPVALFVGDSYTAGSGGAGVRRSFACLTARAMGWLCRNDGEPGTGYTNPGKVPRPTGDTYASRALRARATATATARGDVDVVVVSGGRNDSASPVPVRVAAAGLALGRLRVTYPNARIVVVGPFWVDDDVPPSLLAFDAGLRAEAAARSLTFLDPIRGRWLTTDQRARWIDDDGVHPSIAGHQRLAARLVADLEAAGL
jgi:acyl-CoA thioesterase-1